MSTVLYPVFVYMFLYMLMVDYWPKAKDFFNRFSKDFVIAHKDELEALQSLTRETLFDEDIFKKYIKDKCVLNISPYSYKLLLHFVQLRMLIILLHIFNMHIKFQIISDRWTLEHHSTNPSFSPYTKEQLDEINSKEVMWKELTIMTEPMEEVKESPNAENIRIPLPNLDMYFFT